jgi:hypothetical protein
VERTQVPRAQEFLEGKKKHLVICVVLPFEYKKQKLVTQK